MNLYFQYLKLPIFAFELIKLKTNTILNSYPIKDMEQSIIIAGHAGLGKTTLAQKYPNLCIDLESSHWSKIESIDSEGNTCIKENLNFPLNYIEEIKNNLGKYKYILISPNPYVQLELLKNELTFYVIYPKTEEKEEYINRYIDRGSDCNFIRIFNNNWNKILKSYTIIKDKRCIYIETCSKYLTYLLLKLKTEK